MNTFNKILMKYFLVLISIGLYVACTDESSTKSFNEILVDHGLNHSDYFLSDLNRVPIDSGVIDQDILDAQLESDAEIDSFVYTPMISEAIIAYDPIDLVDPMIATGGQIAEIASVTPAASAPLGLTLVGPDTRMFEGSFAPYHCAGYHYPDTHIQGFSHTHAHGMGVVDYGGISLMPRAQWKPSYRTIEGRQAPFSHDEEWSSPGYYGVQLQDDQTQVHIVATPRGAHHKYLFTADSTPVIIIDLGKNLQATESSDSSINIVGTDVSVFQRVEGQYSKRFNGVMHYAAMRFDPPPITVMGWSDENDMMAGDSFNGTHTRAYLQFPAGTSRVDVRVGLSYVDFDGAWLNLEAELPTLDQEARLQDTQNRWRSLLSKIRVRGDETDLRRFTTAHYHSLLMPSIQNDIDGRYRGLDQMIHTADFNYYSDLSLWDTFRTLHPFYILAHPQIQLDLLRSLIRMSEDGGSLPRWPLAHGYTSGMVGSPATQVFAGSFLKGMTTGWNHQVGFDIALAHASQVMPNANRQGIEAYLNLGWIPADEFDASVSLTLEYAWSDFSLAQWAARIDDPAQDRLLIQSQQWHHHWSEEHQFMIGKNRDGSFTWNGVARQWSDLYIEGNAWHYLWYIPYDISGMIQVQHQGDKLAFLTRLKTYWQSVFEEENDLLPDEFYWHGNEPVMHYAWLGSLAGDHELSVRASHWVLAERYGHTHLDGLDGNDDSGTLSAWYLWAAMGLYPIAGTEVYALGAPIFDRIEIDQAGINGDTLVIQSEGAGWHRVPRHVLAGTTLLDQPQITHEQVQQGLIFVY